MLLLALHLPPSAPPCSVLAWIKDFAEQHALDWVQVRGGQGNGARGASLALLLLLVRSSIRMGFVHAFA